MRYQSYLNTTKKIIENYKGEEPLANHLKKYFSANKKHGSKDRKQIAQLCYCFFRLGKLATDLNSIDKNILLGCFLTHSVFNEIIVELKPEWGNNLTVSLKEKISFLHIDVEKIFPFKEELSPSIEYHLFCQSFLIQPKLFLRLRPNKKNIVTQKLQTKKIPFAIVEENSIALANSTKLDDLILSDKEAVIQDYNSQKVFDFIKTFWNKDDIVKAWDCCAASGGKSILLFDILQKKMNLTVSDIRLSIILNLHKRFLKAGIKNYNYFVEDLSQKTFSFPTLISKGEKIDEGLNKYQLIICDAPCTGSGTWSRTPENLFYFNAESILQFAKKQQQIVFNIIPYLQKNGLLVYITCSVFKNENEGMIDFIKQHFKLQLLYTELLKGYQSKADTMFVAIFKNA